MTRKITYSVLLTLFAVVIFLSCKKDSDIIDSNEPPVTHFPIPTVSPVSGSVSGIVFDEGNAPMADATVTCAGHSIQTDALGHFEIRSLTLDKYVSTVTVSKAGYFKAYRSFCAQPSMNYIEIKLLPKVLTGTFSSAGSGTVSLANGTEITFEANSIVVKNTGASFSGSVNVFATYIDPTASDLAAVIPGSLTGRDANNLYTLQSTGMIAVEMQSASGEALQLATGKKATIKLPIPASLLSNAPAVIDTWSLGEDGIWVKEGTAPKSGNYYEMEVSHFSFWNCDFPSGATYLTVHLQDQQGHPLTNTLVQLVNPSVSTGWGVRSYGTTDSLGNTSGMVPSNTLLKLNIVPGYQCTTPLYTQDIGPFTTDTSITVTATLSSQQSLTVTGTVNGCNNLPLASGQAIISAGGRYYYTTISNGVYTTTFTICSTLSSISVKVKNDSQNIYANSGTVPVSGNTVTVTSLTVCNPVATYVPNCATSTVTGDYYAGTQMNGNNDILLPVNVTAVGSYSITTDAVNGLSFTGSGYFSTTGSNIIVLQGSGNPISAGNFTYTTQNAGMTNCSFQVIVTTGAVYTTNCIPVAITGVYNAGSQLGVSNAVLYDIIVNVPGSHAIRTDTVNGVNFYADGGTSFNSIRLAMYGRGTPVNPGTFTYHMVSGPLRCSFSITFASAGSPRASFTLTGIGGGCDTIPRHGNFLSGIPLTNDNYVTMQANVTSPGEYEIYGYSTNDGSLFRDTGIFVNTGINLVNIRGYGTNITGGARSHLLHASGQINTSPVCYLQIPFESARYTYATGPGGDCTINLNGTYTFNTPLISTNTVSLLIDVTTGGYYYISTGMVNGIKFSKAGFISSGPQYVTLYGIGTPIASGNFTYAAESSNDPGCSFVVPVN